MSLIDVMFDSEPEDLDLDPELLALMRKEDSLPFRVGSRVFVRDEYKGGVRSYDLGQSAEVEAIDTDVFDASCEAYLVWPSGSGIWIDVDNVRPATQPELSQYQLSLFTGDDGQ